MISFDEYLRNFDYNERKEMKIQIPELIEGYAEGKIELSEELNLLDHLYQFKKYQNKKIK